MVLRKIAVAFDGSPCSQRALEWAVKLAGQIQAEILLISVVAPLSTSFILDPEGVTHYTLPIQEAAEQGLLTLLDNAEDYCRQASITATSALRHGNPVDEIVACAKETSADVILCGTRGLGGFKGLLLGSIAHRLVTFSPIPVLVVK